MLKEGLTEWLQSKKLSFPAPADTSLSLSLVNTGVSKEGFVAKYGSFLLLWLPHFGEFAFNVLGPCTKVSACIQKTVKNVCNGMFAREGHCLQDAHFQMPTPHYPMRADFQQSFKFLAHLPHVRIHFLGPLHFLHTSKVIVSVRNPRFSKVEVHCIVISFGTFGIWY